MVLFSHKYGIYLHEKTAQKRRLKMGGRCLVKKSVWLLLVVSFVGLGIAWAIARDASGNAPPSGRVEGADPDTDGDGLSDFHEIHKYGTDPKKSDTAGKGVADGDWKQRREFTYSVRAIIRVMPPYNLKALNDDYQDVRARAEKKEY